MVQFAACKSTHSHLFTITLLKPNQRTVDIVASKIASFVIGIGLLAPAVRVDSFIAFLSIAALEGIMIGLWFGDHGNALRYFGEPPSSFTHTHSSLTAHLYMFLRQSSLSA